jgi:hypothetical protein
LIVLDFLYASLRGGGVIWISRPIRVLKNQSIQRPAYVWVCCLWQFVSVFRMVGYSFVVSQWGRWRVYTVLASIFTISTNLLLNRYYPSCYSACPITIFIDAEIGVVAGSDNIGYVLPAITRSPSRTTDMIAESSRDLHYPTSIIINVDTVLRDVGVFQA